MACNRVQNGEFSIILETSKPLRLLTRSHPMKKILILASNPRKNLDLAQEIRNLKDVIEQSPNHPQLEVVDERAVRVGDLQRFLFKHKPQIVHFCGHGCGEEGLVLESSKGGEQRVGTEALTGLFKLVHPKISTIECVLLNACYSEEQANAIVTHIDYVIGIRQTILDVAAIAFSEGFYRALGYGCSIEQSYAFGCNAIQLETSENSNEARSSVSEVERKLEVVNEIANMPLSENLKPILRKKENLSAAQAPEESSPEDQQAYGAEEPSSQFRRRVREFLDDDHFLSELDMLFLYRFRTALELSPEDAGRIIEEEQTPFQQAQKDYTEFLIELVQQGYYPFDEATRQKLREFQQEKKLKEQEVEIVSRDILEVAKRYTKLRDLLKARQWREADQETARQMCEAMGRQSSGWLRPEDIQNFPLFDLRTIDRLWTKYSNGRFGFSVQKQIWQECGSPNDFNSDWESFVERVGWQSQASFTFNISAPKGHLPVCSHPDDVDRCSVWTAGVSSFASRLQT
jgi:GUN4-like